VFRIEHLSLVPQRFCSLVDPHESPLASWYACATSN
jgi:hypothetical protein